MLKIITPLILVAALTMSLLNGNAFGSPTLFALFFFTLFTGIAGMVFFLTLIFRRKTTFRIPPLPVLCFLALSVFVMADGIVREFNLTHLLWFAYTLWLLILYCWAITVTPLRKTPPAFFFYRIITLLALIETVIVLLQTARLFPVPSQYFLSTGTWINPNVTAIFIALSLFAVFRLKTIASPSIQKFIYWPILALMMAALAFLQCRSAWLAAIVLWIGEYRRPLLMLIRKNATLNWRGLLLVIALLMAVQLLFTLYSTKEASAQSRMRIWKNSWQLITQKPLTGYGFGTFEREFNLFSATQKEPVNDHVNMAYNDFLELGVEGGFVAVILYIAFLVLLFMACLKNEYSRLFIPVIIACIVVQLTNFGLQAIPAMALMLLYCAVALVPVKIVKPVPLPVKKKKTLVAAPVPSQVYTKWWTRATVGSTGLIISFLLFLQVSMVSSGFYNRNLIVHSEATTEAKMERLEKQHFKMRFSPGFYESYGDLCLKLQLPKDALGMYRLALKRSSDPDLFAKIGYCYQLVSGYDSCLYYYEIASNMQPHRFTPRLHLMQLYAEKRDTTALLQTANSILQMPVKVNSKKVTEIQRIAKSVIDIYEHHSTAAPF